MPYTTPAQFLREIADKIDQQDTDWDNSYRVDRDRLRRIASALDLITPEMIVTMRKIGNGDAKDLPLCTIVADFLDLLTQSLT